MNWVLRVRISLLLNYNPVFISFFNSVWTKEYITVFCFFVSKKYMWAPCTSQKLFLTNNAFNIWLSSVAFLLTLSWTFRFEFYCLFRKQVSENNAKNVWLNVHKRKTITKSIFTNQPQLNQNDCFSVSLFITLTND
jgi:hypothetical protein